jgi:hypothetical protein
VTSNESVRDSLSACSMYIGRIAGRRLFNCDHYCLESAPDGDPQNVVSRDVYRRIAEERLKQMISIASLLLKYCSELLTPRVFKRPTIDAVLSPYPNYNDWR